MPLAYKISDIIISSSVEPEAFGRVAIEAQSMQKPIIASNIGGSNETIINDKTGIYLSLGKPESLSKKIMEVLQLDETTLKSIGNEGRKNVIKKFNIEKMCLTTYSEYKKLNFVMPNIKLPDGNSINFEKTVTGLQIAEKISKSLLKQALIISVDGNLKDLNYEIDKDCSVKIHTAKDKEGLETIRHDTAHILAMAVQELFQELKLLLDR